MANIAVQCVTKVTHTYSKSPLLFCLAYSHYFVYMYSFRWRLLKKYRWGGTCVSIEKAEHKCSKELGVGDRWWHGPKNHHWLVKFKIKSRYMYDKSVFKFRKQYLCLMRNCITKIELLPTNISNLLRFWKHNFLLKSMCARD